MRVIFLLLFISSTISFSQNTFYKNGVKTKNFQNNITGQNLQATCSQSILSNYFENGVGFDVGRDYKCANDIMVTAGEDLILNQIIFVSMIGVGVVIDFAEISIYSDNEGLPDALLSSQTVIATTQYYNPFTFGFSLVTGTYDITPVVLAGDLITETTYWVVIQVTTDDGSIAFWEDTSSSFIGNFVAFNEGTDWESLPAFDGVYFFNGDCEPILNIDDNFIGNIFVYPNPVNSILHIETQEQVKRVQVFNLLGKEVFTKEKNTKLLDFSNYTKGIYFIRIETGNGIQIEKIIKR